jgi:tetratricopeptide (TPR) repeat protein
VPEPYALKALLLSRMSKGDRKQEEEAIRNFKSAVEFDPKNASLRSLYASVLRKEPSKFPAALLEYKQAIGLTEARNKDPAPSLLNNTAVLLTQPATQNWAEAEKLFKRALGGKDIASSITADASPETISYAPRASEASAKGRFRGAGSSGVCSRQPNLRRPLPHSVSGSSGVCSRQPNL